jgi:23S rRNA pseudouridine1911/1915/1917 synthase
MITNREFTVSADQADRRLDQFVTRACPSSKRSLVVDAIGAGDITINGRRGAKGHRVAVGDTIGIRTLFECNDVRVTPNDTIPLTIVHADRHLLVFDKPAGIPVHPIHHSETGTLANAAVARFPELQDIGDDPLFPALVHRIDTDTSGLVLAARSPDVYRTLRDQFAARAVTKEYVALVEGTVPSPLVLTNLLVHSPHRRGKMLVVDDKPRTAPNEQRFEAISSVETERAFSSHALVRVVIRTGITHQIRCQLAHAGLPLVGDRVYGRPERSDLLPGRHFLHARALEFAHPANGEQFSVRAELPAELEAVLDAISGRPAGM